MDTPEFDATKHQAPTPTTTPVLKWVLAMALVLLVALTWGGWQAVLQIRTVSGVSFPNGALALYQATRGNDTHTLDTRAPTPGPSWFELTATQKQALHPLAEHWPFLSQLQKRRWMVLAQSFASLPAPEQSKLHERMAEWASLSAQQRNQARLNFAKAKQLAPDNKRAQWEAYQALTNEEKRILAAGAGPRPLGAATALQPVPARKLAQIPAATASNANPVNPPKIPLLSASSQHLRPIPAASGIGGAGAGTETRPPIAPESTMVETAPVSVPTAEPLPLPPLPTEPGAPPSPDAPSPH